MCACAEEGSWGGCGCVTGLKKAIWCVCVCARNRAEKAVGGGGGGACVCVHAKGLTQAVWGVCVCRSAEEGSFMCVCAKVLMQAVWCVCLHRAWWRKGSRLPGGHTTCAGSGLGCTSRPPRPTPPTTATAHWATCGPWPSGPCSGPWRSSSLTSCTAAGPQAVGTQTPCEFSCGSYVP